MDKSRADPDKRTARFGANSDQWRVVAGLHAGERVIVQGQVKAKIDAPVKPVVVKLDSPTHG